MFVLQCRWQISTEQTLSTNSVWIVCIVVQPTMRQLNANDNLTIKIAFIIKTKVAPRENIV